MRTCRLLLLVLGVLAAAVLLAAEARAQEESHSEALLLAEIPSVFGASRFDQLATEAPAAVTIVTADEIQTYGWRTLGEIVSGARSFYLTDDLAYQYVGVRGFSRPGDYNSRVLVLVDGNRVNDNIYDAVSYGRDGFIDVRLIDRVEMIRGPSSSLYGTSAFFGVINIVTRSGRSMGGARLHAAGGSAEGYEGTATYGRRYPSGMELVVSGLVQHSGGESLYFPQFDAPETNYGRASSVHREHRGNLFGKLNWGRLTLEAGMNSRELTVPTGLYGTVFNDPRARSLDQSALVSLQYQRSLDSGGELSALLSHHWYDYNATWPYAEVVNEDRAHGRWWIAEGRAVRPHGRHKFVAGAEGRINTRQEQLNRDLDPSYVYLHDNTRSHALSVYGQDEYRLSRRLILNGGLRYDYYSSFGAATSPRLGLIIGTGTGSAVKILAGSAFRAPNNYESHYDDGGATQKPNPDLRPEHIRTYEVLVEHAFNSWSKGTAGVYRFDVDNIISQVVDPADDLHVFQNVDEVQGQGVELETAIDRAGFSSRVSYAYQRSHDRKTGEELTNSPRHLGTINLSAPLWHRRLRAACEIQAMSKRIAADGRAVPGHGLVHLNLAAVEWVRGLAISAGVRNVLAADYADPVSSVDGQSTVAQGGRTFRLAADYGF